MKLLRNIKRKKTKDKIGEMLSVQKQIINNTELLLIHCNVVKNSYQQNSRFLYIFVPSNSLGQLLNVSPQNFLFLKTFQSKFLYIEFLCI